MNARQSKPPLSRRQLRDKAGVGSDEAGSPGVDEASSTNSAERETVAPVRSAGGRRVRWDPAGPPSPTDDADSGSTRDGISAATAEAASDDPADAGPPFRKRDFRPEGRRSSFAPAFVTGGTREEVDVPPLHDAVEVASADGANPATAASEGSPPGIGSGGGIDLDAPERTMTRRELRILRARAEAAGLPAPDVMFLPNGESTVTGAIPVLDGRTFQPAVAPVADAAGVVTEEQVPRADEDRADDDQTDDDADEAGEHEVDVAEGATPQVIPALVEPDRAWNARLPAGTDAAASDIPAEIVVDAEPATGDHPVSEAAVEESEPVAADDSDPSAPPAPGRLRPFDAMFLPPSARTDGDEVVDPLLDTSSAQPVNDADGLRGDILAAPVGAARPFGHWSTQDGDDDATGESTLSRDVGTGVVTTHALVLPSVPDASEPFLSPLTSTGEVMVTGIVELPKSYGSTGAHPALFDHSEVDSLIDDTDREDAESGAAPVRATRAVSSTTTTRSMVETAPTKRSRVLPVVAIVVGGVVLVAAASWAIAAIFFNAF